MSEDKIIQNVPSEILNIANKMKQDGFNLLIAVTGIDKGEFIEVIYHFENTETSQDAYIKAKLDRNSPQIDSLSGIYSSANWHEREVFDLLGVKFNNHPNLTRILLPNDWIGYPLRKDYKMEDKRLEWNER